jgi:hypothetical protein
VQPRLAQNENARMPIAAAGRTSLATVNQIADLIQLSSAALGAAPTLFDTT